MQMTGNVMIDIKLAHNVVHVCSQVFTSRELSTDLRSGHWYTVPAKM